MSTPTLHTEKVTRPDGEKVWIAYPDHVLAYGRSEDRLSRATGIGATKRDALDSARTDGEWKDSRE